MLFYMINCLISVIMQVNSMLMCLLPTIKNSDCLYAPNPIFDYTSTVNCSTLCIWDIEQIHASVITEIICKFSVKNWLS